MRRTLSVLAATTCLVLAGCGQNWGFGSGSSAGVVHLTYALWDPNEQIGYQKSIDVFEKKHPNIHVTIENIPYGSYQPKLTSEFISHNAPDVFWVNTPFLGTWIKDGVMMNLWPKIRADHVDMTQYFPQLVKLHEYKGKIYGLPKDWDTICFYYNKDYFAQHHIKAPTRLTWRPDGSGTFLPFLKRLTIDSNGHNALSPQFNPHNIKTYALATGNDMQSGYENYLAMNGSGIFKRAYDKKVTFDDPKGVQAFQFDTDLINKWHVAVPGSELGPNADDSLAEQVFARGGAAMWQAGDWNTTSLKEAATFKVGVLPLPSGPEGRVSVFNGLIDAINKDTPHPKEAWELEKWLGSAQSEKILGEGGYVWPAIKSLDTYFLKAWRKNGIDLQPFLDEARGKVVNWPVSIGVGDAINDMTLALGPIYLGSNAVGSAVRKAATYANHDLAVATS